MNAGEFLMVGILIVLTIFLVTLNGTVKALDRQVNTLQMQYNIIAVELTGDQDIFREIENKVPHYKLKEKDGRN